MAAYGQVTSSTLTGIVSDASGAVVPKANITLTNIGTGDQRKTITNDSGYFSVVSVPAGEYTLTVEAPGFQKAERKGIGISGGDHITMNDIVLQVGAATETVSVSAVLETLTPVDNGEKSNVLTTRQLQDFTVVGRSAAEFIKIMPGFAINNGVQNRMSFTGEVIGINGNGDGGSQSALNSAFAAQGLGAGAIDITADGAHVSDPGCNCATPVNPNTDMIQEFKVMTNAFSAENSKGPIVINSVAKAGTRDFHGEAYFYARHYSMNSNDAINNMTGVSRPNNKYFFPGGNISGPVLFPKSNFNKNRDKLFFFTGFEYYLQTLDTGLLDATVPTAGMRNGNFSPAELAKLGKTSGGGGPEQIKDFTTCPGGICPSSAFFPGGQNQLNLYPMPNKDPNATGGYNYVDAVLFNQNSWQSMSRVDYSISDNTKLFVRANLQGEVQYFPVTLWWRNGGSVPYPTMIDAPNTSKSVSTSLTHVFSPTLTNEFVFGYTFIDFNNKFHDPSKISRKALGFTFPGVYPDGIDQMPSLGSWGSELATIYNPGGFEAGHGDLYATKHLLSGADNISKVWGTHTMKAGFFTEFVVNAQPGNGDTGGWAIFANWQGNTSGNTYADLLLGRPVNYMQLNKVAVHNEGYKTFEGYLQDSWKVVPRLTLDYGVRIQHLGNWYDRLGKGFAVWDQASYSATVTDPTKYTGLLWMARNSAIPNSGWPTKALWFTPRAGIAYDLFGNGKTVLRGGFGMYRYNNAQSTQGMDEAWGQLSYNQSGSYGWNDYLAIVQAYSRTSVGLVDRNDSNKPVTYNYNFTISERLPGATQWELSYVGSQSNHGGAGQGAYNVDMNKVPVGTLWKFADPNNPPGNYDDYRPLNNYQSINIAHFLGYSNYNSFQTTLARQKGRWNYQFNYTWSKALGISNAMDPWNINNNYGLLTFDRAHIFNGAYSVELGNFVKGNKLAQGLVNGWQLSGITQLQSGVDLASNSNANNSSDNFTITVNNVPGNGFVNPYGTRYLFGTDSMTVQPILTCDPTKGLAKNQYMNGACFAYPTQRNANGPTRIPAIRGPWFVNSDLAMFKNFQINESKKIQLRFNAYNFLNHPLPSFINAGDSNLKLTYNYNATGAPTLANPTFGYADYKYGHRVIQLALKFYF